ncbi:GGDEF domain-containing protein [bacterium]|nr:GGDEF domain-containing protein [bacterium]
MNDPFARPRALSKQEHWFLTGYRVALPFLMAVIAHHIALHQGTIVAWSKAPVLAALLVLWLLTFARPVWALRVDVAVISIAICASLATGLTLLFLQDVPGGAILLRDLAFWTPVICAYWAMLLYSRPWLSITLVVAFVGALLGADLHLRAQAVLPILPGSALQVLAQTVILVVMVRAFGAVHATVTGQRDRARKKALRDELTGLFNRFAFEHELRRAVKLAARHQAVFSLVVIDIDHFKRFNDRFGHLAGDAVLRSVARVFRGTLRQTDVISRWGGEEFAVILPNTAAPEACLISNKLRQRIAAQPPASGDRVTISCGVATYLAHDQPRAIFERADAALRDAKNTGRNRVICSEQCPNAPYSEQLVPVPLE